MTRSRLVLPVLALVALGVGFAAAVGAPREATQGEFARIMFVHVPSAWLAFLAFGVTLLGGVMWLIRKNMLWDRIAASSAEVGVFFTGLALITGMIWGYPVWGTFWDWGDARMMSTAVMFFVYTGYLALRRSVPDPETRARRSAVLGIIAFVQVPLVYFSVTIVRTLHQGLTFTGPDSSIDEGFVGPLLINLAAFTLVYVAFTTYRTRLLKIEDDLEAEEAIADLELAGLGITEPRLGGAAVDG
ncbi:MAG: cytochrome c biogenesis protein CcsA [Acidimicrobiia bacterium]|nr:cytochrome c biogenesis protein CcsA [Acidimicrobiia bacterium]MBT8214761.1 cytochrome c biogenesis protein CcsA [Acidimicrobiia bacterium]NNF68560.1 cytochrome c biogenesis protein CcsA [Acidimicrobiia bacterium]NNK91251.1 cytochrome c biogenesis protein CcsA [Acidimicrobiia bacterium]